MDYFKQPPDINPAPFPKYHELMRPMLEAVIDGQPHHVKEVIQRMMDARAHMRHVLIVLKEPGNQASDDHKLAFVAAQNLTNFQEHRFHSCRAPVVVVSS